MPRERYRLLTMSPLYPCGKHSIDLCIFVLCFPAFFDLMISFGQQGLIILRLKSGLDFSISDFRQRKFSQSVNHNKNGRKSCSETSRANSHLVQAIGGFSEKLRAIRKKNGNCKVVYGIFRLFDSGV